MLRNLSRQKFVLPDVVNMTSVGPLSPLYLDSVALVELATGRDASELSACCGNRTPRTTLSCLDLALRALQSSREAGEISGAEHSLATRELDVRIQSGRLRLLVSSEVDLPPHVREVAERRRLSRDQAGLLLALELSPVARQSIGPNRAVLVTGSQALAAAADDLGLCAVAPDLVVREEYCSR